MGRDQAGSNAHVPREGLIAFSIVYGLRPLECAIIMAQIFSCCQEISLSLQ